MIYGTIVAVVILAVIGYVSKRLIDVIIRQSEYIMAIQNEHSFHASKPRAESGTDKKANDKARKKLDEQAKINLLYDSVMARGEVTDDELKILQGAKVN